MAGIYFHIPFCRKACHYCDFHFSTNLTGRTQMLAAMKTDLCLQHDFLGGEEIKTIYFGGGTPSLLTRGELASLLNEVHILFQVSAKAEVTLEANPDDVTFEKVIEWVKLGINRVSLGVQSFFDEDLVWMNRSHSAGQALSAISTLQQGGVSNLSVDLIYGFPLLSDEKLALNVEKVLEFGIPHLSCYSMTVEPKTALAFQIGQGRSPELDEDKAANQFLYLIDRLTRAGYDHYEISNFSLPGQHSIHNTNYWRGERYLGVGPSAHSYDRELRRNNISNNHQYVKFVDEGTTYFDQEFLTEKDKFNEYIMLNLRTMWGLDLNNVESLFGAEYAAYLQGAVLRSLKDGHLDLSSEKVIRLTGNGKLVADKVLLALFAN